VFEDAQLAKLEEGDPFSSPDHIKGGCLQFRLVIEWRHGFVPDGFVVN
jgi:hypothetical protein